MVLPLRQAVCRTLCAKQMLAVRTYALCSHNVLVRCSQLVLCSLQAAVQYLLNCCEVLLPLRHTKVWHLSESSVSLQISLNISLWLPKACLLVEAQTHVVLSAHVKLHAMHGSSEHSSGKGVKHFPDEVTIWPVNLLISTVQWSHAKCCAVCIVT